MADESRNPIDVLAEEYAEKCRRGQAPSVDDYVKKHPELASQIREILPTVAMMEQLKQRKKGDNIPERVGEYQIVREIGRGGMGIVYEAEHKALGRRVALKVAPMHALMDPVRLERFQREAQAAARLHHTNIVPVFGVGESGGLHYIVMQYIGGCALNEVLETIRNPAKGSTGTSRRPAVLAHVPKNRGRDYFRWVAQIGVQIAGALGYAHEKGTLHRDIKPGNILMDSHGVAWIADFGLAKIASNDDLTQTGDIIGTVQYMAPEALQGKGDERSDVYGVAMTLYEMLTLQPPYKSNSTLDLLKKITEQEPIRPRVLDKSIPVDLETIVAKAGARNPADRYQSAKELSDDLRRFLEDMPIAARPVLPHERFWRWCRRNRAIAALSLTAVASLICALIVGWVGYVKTTDALARESKRRQDADEATQRSEANVRMSLEAFENIFTQTGNDVGPPPMDPRGGPPVPVRESQENAAMLQTILDFYERFAAANKTNNHLQFEAARAHARIGELQMRMNELEKAEASFRRALDMAEKLSAEEKGRQDRPALLAQTHSGLGSVLHRLREHKPAEEHYRISIAQQLIMCEKEPWNSDARVHLAMQRLSLADLLYMQHRDAEARTLVETSIADLESRRDKRPSKRLAPSLAMQYRFMARLLADAGEQKQADEMARKSRELEPYESQNRPNRPPPRDDFRGPDDFRPDPEREFDGPDRRPPPRRPPPRDGDGPRRDFDGPPPRDDDGPPPPRRL